MDKKLDYITPTVDVFTVQTEGVICQSTGNNGIKDWETPGKEFPLPF